jgi:hypothetical protein
MAYRSVRRSHNYTGPRNYGSPDLHNNHDQLAGPDDS